MNRWRGLYETYRRWILFVYAFVSIALSGGTVYGWPALRRALVDEGDATEQGSLSEAQLGIVFTVGAWTSQAIPFLAGLARDRYGTQKITTISLLSAAAGFAGMAWSSATNVPALSTSMLLMGMGTTVQLCTQPVAGLFPQYGGSVLGSLSGGFQLSGMMYLVLTKIGRTRQSAFTTFAIILAVLAVIAILLLPKGGFQEEREEKRTASLSPEHRHEEQEEYDKATGILPERNMTGRTSILNGTLTIDEFSSDIEVQISSFPKTNGSDTAMQRSDSVESQPSSESTQRCNNDDGDEGSNQKSMEPPTAIESQPSSESTSRNNDDGDEDSNRKSIEPPTAIQQILSLEYVLLFCWFSFSVLPLQYYIGTIGFQLEEKGDEDGVYTTLYSAIYSSAAILAPMGGWIADKWGLGIAQAMASTLSAASFFWLASPLSLDGQIVGLVCYSIGRLFVFSSFFAHVGKRFGYQHYGTLVGLGLLLSALISLLQYPMIEATANGYAREMNLLCGAIFVCMAPYFPWLIRKERQDIEC